jgi:hypothetical protein
VRKTLIEGVRNYLIESPLRVRNFVIVSSRIAVMLAGGAWTDTGARVVTPWLRIVRGACAAGCSP